MIPKFKCTQCGQCCSHIKGFISDSEKEFLKEYAFGKLPLIQLFPVEEMSLPLFDFEAKRFKEWATELGIDCKIKPSRVIFDLNSEKSIVVTYYIDHESCPFLKDDGCVIYDKKRGFVCRFFPFNKGPFLKTGDKLKKEDMFGSCPAVEKIIPELDDSDRKKLVEQLKESFENELPEIVEYDNITGWTNKLIIDLMKEKKIRPAMKMPYRFLLKRINNSEKVDLMDFLVEEGIKTYEEIKKLINRFDNNVGAEEELKEFLEQ